MVEFVRVKDPDTGHEVTMSVEQATLVDAKPLEKKNATTADGSPLEPKYHTTVDAAASAAASKGA